MRSACSERLAVDAMGTRFELVIAGVECAARATGRARATGVAARVRAIGEEALGLVLEWHGRLNRFDPGSLLSHVNARAGKGWVSVDREMIELLTRCARLWRETRGAFDPSVGAAVRGQRLRPGRDRPQRRGLAGVEIDEARARIRFLEPGIQLDLGAIAKGFVLDLLGETLREARVTSALVHGGTSSVLAIGSAPGGTDWVVAIAGAQGPRVALSDTGMSVSAGRMGETERVAHTVDPRTGEMVGPEACACAIGASAAACEAWSTALLVLGERPASMPAVLTSVVRPGEEHAWRVEGEMAWRVSCAQEGAMRI